MLPNISPKLFSGSAVLVGFLLLDDATANEQNALGNWLMLVAQVLSTNAYYKDLLKERGFPEGGRNNAYAVPNNGRFTNRNNNRYSNTNSDDTEETLIMLQKIVKAIQKEIDEIKSSL